MHLTRLIKKDIDGIMRKYDIDCYDESGKMEKFHNAVTTNMKKILGDEVMSSVRIDGDNIILESNFVADLQFIPFIVEVEPNKIYILNSGKVSGGSISFAKIEEPTKVGWNITYLPNLPINYVKIDIVLDK